MKQSFGGPEITKECDHSLFVLSRISVLGMYHSTILLTRAHLQTHPVRLVLSASGKDKKGNKPQTSLHIQSLMKAVQLPLSALHPRRVLKFSRAVKCNCELPVPLTADHKSCDTISLLILISKLG